jgi:predicted dehydrogenase
VWTRDCDDLARIAIDYDNGSVAIVEINTTTKRPLPRWQVDGEKGSAQSPFDLSFNTNAWAKFDFAPADGSEKRPLALAGPGLSEAEIWKQFIRACRGECESPIPVESVLPTMALLDAARQSSAQGTTIAIDPHLRWAE